MTGSTAARAGIDRGKVDHLLGKIERVVWGVTGHVEQLVETPAPHRHAVRDLVRVIEGKGFAGDHPKKSYYRGEHVPGREVSAISAEVLEILVVDPAVVGDNLITRGVDLRALGRGDLLVAGDVVFERSDKAHRPCVTFRKRTSPEAFAVVSSTGYRGALFVVRKGGELRRGDPLRVRTLRQTTA